ncbi:MAG: hypothetical protein WEB37_11660 [Bacteroidota bacterium]
MTVQGTNTRIDIIFYNRERNIYLVCECKRANPALSNWCFARAPWPTETGFATQSYMETITSREDGVKFGVLGLVHSPRIFQVALEVKTDKKGNSTGSVRGEIEEAATQVARGFNGLISFLGGERTRELVNIGETIGFIPAIFTTAKVYATEAEVTSPDILTGQAGKLEPSLTERDWIWYDYPQSPGLRHTIPNEHVSSNLREIVYREFIRRIAVVTPAGIPNFLGLTTWRLWR